MTVDLLQIIGADTKLTWAAGTHGGEYAGSCSFCGGDDRMRVQPNWKGGQWWCRQCSPDDRWHSAADYLIKRDGITFKEAQEKLGIAPSKPVQPDDPQTYPTRHGATWADFNAWGARLDTYVDMATGAAFDAIFFDDAAGGKYRLFGHNAKFKPARSGQSPCWYGLAEAVILAKTVGQKAIVLVNGQPSVIACHAHGVPAFTIPGGEGNLVTYMNQGLLPQLQAIWQGEILVLLDGDKKGYDAAPKVVDHLRLAGYAAVAKDPGKGNDAADFCVANNSASAANIYNLPNLTPTTTAAPPPPPAMTGLSAADAQFFIDANMTDAGNAECLIKLYADELRYCGAMPGGWLRWSGQHWRVDHLGQNKQFALNTARTRDMAAVFEPDPDKKKRLRTFAMQSENVARIDAMLTSASTMPALATDIKQYDADPMLAATSAGTLDLNTGQLIPASRDHYMTMQLGVAPDPQATAPLWERFMDQVFAGDQDLIKYVQRAIGYSLTGDTRAQCLFLCHGNGSNGKSVMLRIIAALAGDYGGNAGFETFEASQRSGVGEYLAILRGKRFVTIIETEEDRRLAEAKVKLVSDGSDITCRFLHANPFTFRPVCKIWFAMNHKPVIRGTDYGIWRRVKMIPFLQKFEGAQLDDTLESKLLAELPGILNWALEGLAEWRKSGLGSCAAIDAATKQYKAESDVIQRWFEEEVEENPVGEMTTEAGYKNFQDWCAVRGDRFIANNTVWGRWLADKGYQSARLARVVGMGKKKLRTVYMGIQLIDP